jgi:hypothetical protein
VNLIEEKNQLVGLYQNLKNYASQITLKKIKGRSIVWGTLEIIYLKGVFYPGHIKMFTTLKWDKAELKMRNE